LPGLLDPRERLEPEDVERGLRMQVADGMCSQSLVTLTQGTIFVAFALLLQASNTAIGLVSAINPFANILQVPAIALVEKVARRKWLVVTALVPGRMLWILVAALPWVVPAPARMPVLVATLAVHFTAAAIAGCAWNSWMHALIPPDRLNGFFSRRLSMSMWLGAGLSLSAGLSMDAWERSGNDPFGIFAILFGAGAAAGLLGCLFLALTPEPRMRGRDLGRLRDVVTAPLRDAAFRPVIVFFGVWTFAASLAAPFFPVYLIRRLDQGMASVLGLSVLSQAAFAMSLKPWGRFAARHGNRRTLMLAAPVFLATLLLWPATSLPLGGAGLHVVLVTIHVLSGAALGGVTLCAGNLVMREAPPGGATAYLAANSLVAGIAATAAPLLAGIGSDVAKGAGWALDVGPLSLTGLDFVFLAAALVGLESLRRLAGVREAGLPAAPADLRAIWAEALRGVWQTSTVGGLRRMTAFPYGRLRLLLTRRGRREDRPSD
jgi:MFS family permease